MSSLHIKMRSKTYPEDSQCRPPDHMDRPMPLPSAQEEQQHFIHKELKLAWIALKALGLLPFFIKQPPASGGKRIFIYAVQAAYAIGFYIAFGYYALHIAKQIISNLEEDSVVTVMGDLAFSVPHVFIGPLQWVKMRHVLRFFNDWDAFQSEHIHEPIKADSHEFRMNNKCFLRVTHNSLQLRMSWVSSITIILTVAGYIGYTLLIIHLAFGEDYKDSVFYIYAAVQVKMLLAVWVLLCLASARAADQLALRLKEDLACAGSVSGHLINGYQSTWLRLSQLTRDIGDVFCHVFNVIVILCLVQMLLAAFQGAKLFVNGCSMGLYIGIGGLAIDSFLVIQVFCFAGNYATDKVSGKFVKCLAEIQVEIDDIQKQLHDLAHAVSTHGAVINLGGFYVVDRSLIVSVLSAFATFMVVLIQSAPKGDNSC